MNINSCCGLPNGQHRCYDQSCGRKSRIYDTFDALVSHVVDKSHVDARHNLDAALAAARSARDGVAAVVQAEKTAGQGGDVSSGEGDALAQLDKAEQQTTKKRKRLIPRVDDDDDVDDKIDDDDEDSDVASESSQVRQTSGTLSSSVPTPSPVATLAHQLQETARAKQMARRKPAKKARTKSSVWLAVGALGGKLMQVGNVKAATCGICDELVHLNNRGASSNMKGHFERFHKTEFAWLVSHGKGNAEATLTYIKERRDLHERERAESAVTTSRSKSDMRSHVVGVPPLRSGGASESRAGAASPADVKQRQRVAGVLYAAATETSFSQIGSQLHAGYVSAIGGPAAGRQQSTDAEYVARRVRSRVQADLHRQRRGGCRLDRRGRLDKRCRRQYIWRSSHFC